jgi:hypothetical protein
MTMPRALMSTRGARPARRVWILRALAAALAAPAAVLLIACGSSGKGLIPASAAGPLESDFEEVQQAAESGNGDCSATEAALLKTQQDFSALPASINPGLRNNLHQGIANLVKRAREVCLQPGGQTATTGTTKTTTTTPTTSTPTTSTSTTTTQTTPSTTTPTKPGRGGGTPAPHEEEAPAEESEGGGTGAGEGGAGGVGAGEPEAGK